MPQALSFLHPLLMWVLLGLMLYSGYLGLKASQIRKVDAAERKEMIPLRYGQRHALQKGHHWRRHRQQVAECLR